MVDIDGIEVAAFIIPSAVSLGFMISMGFRFGQLHSDRTIRRIKINRILLIRVSLVLLEISAEITSLFLGSFYSEYAYYNRAFQYLNILNIIAQCIQVVLMVTQNIIKLSEFNKRVPIFIGHKLYWIICLVETLILFIYLAINNDDSEQFSKYTIILARLALFAALLISLVIRPQDREEFYGIPFLKDDMPELKMTNNFVRQSQIGIKEFTEMQQFFRVEVKKRWNILDGQLEFKMEVTLFPSRKSISLKKSLQQLKEMHMDLQIQCEDYLKDNPVIEQELQSLIQSIQEATVQQAIGYITRYFNTVNEIRDLSCEALLDFLQIETDDRQEIRQSVANSRSLLEIQYLPYFNVTIDSHEMLINSFVVYTVTINWAGEETFFKLQKRYKEFSELHDFLKPVINVKALSPFPKKHLINKLTETELNNRQIELELYLKYLLNDRIFHNSVVFDFLGFGNEERERVKKRQEYVKMEAEYLQQVQIMQLGYDEVLNVKGKEYSYVFQVIANGDKHLISRVFSQFEDLHYVLKNRYAMLNEAHNLPELSLKNKTNPLAQAEALQIYIRGLLTMPYIGESVNFRQFMEIKEYDNMRKSSGSIHDFQSIFQKLDDDNKRDSENINRFPSVRKQ